MKYICKNELKEKADWTEQLSVKQGTLLKMCPSPNFPHTAV